MCAVSAVSDWQHKEWKIPTHFPEWKPSPDFKISLEEWHEYQKLKAAAEEYDRKTQQPDCQDELKKAIDNRIKQILIEKGVIK